MGILGDSGFSSGGLTGVFNQATNFLVTEFLSLLGIEIPSIDYEDRKVATRSPTTPRRVIYGSARVGGQYALVETSGDKEANLNVLYIFASHPCEAVDQIFIGDTLSTDPKFTGKLTTITSIDGLGVVPPAISSAFPSFKAEYRFEGLSYLFCQFSYDAEVYQGIPNVSVVVRGKNDILDTRTSTTGYTANAALCELDWLLTQMGANLSDIDEPSWNDAADDCDTLVAAKDSDGNDTTEPRFELNGTISLQGPKLESLVKMTQNGGVIPSYEQGVWSAVIQKFVEPSPGSITYPNVTNLMPNPFDPENWLADVDGTNVNTVIDNPSGVDFVGLATQVLTGTFFVASTTGLNLSIGDKVYIAVICKTLGAYDTAIRFRFADSQGFIGDTVLRGSDGSKTSGGALNTKTTTLPDGFLLLEVELDITRNDSSGVGQLIFWSNDNTGVAPVGAQLYIQAAFYGKSSDFPGVYSIPADFGVDDLISPIQVSSGSNKQDKTNTVKGSFISADNEYEQVEYPSLESPTAIADDLEILERTINYQMVSSASQCRRLSKIFLEQSRFGIAFTAVFKFKVWEFPVGSRIKFSYERFGWVDRVFRISARDIDGINGISMTLREDNADIYSWNEGDALAISVPDLVNLPNADVVLVPESLTAIESLYIANTSKSVKARVEFAWVPGDVTAKNFEVEGSFNGAAFRVFSDFIVGNTFAVDDLELGSWIFRVRAVNGIGAKSDYLSVNTTIVGKTEAPKNVIGFSAEISPFTVELSWQAVTDLDISVYEIRRGSVWDGGQVLQVLSALSWQWETRPTGNENIMIKAIDTSGNYSELESVATLAIQNPSQPSPLTSKAIHSNVELTWPDSTTSFSIDRYEIRKGNNFDGAQILGSPKTTFMAILESIGGAFTYWVTAIDVQGNKSEPASVLVNVDNPLSFVLQADQLLSLQDGTAIDMIAEVGSSITMDSELITMDSVVYTMDMDTTHVLTGPANTTETYKEHMDARIAALGYDVITMDNDTITMDSEAVTMDSGASIQQLHPDQGFPFYLQPTPSTGTFEQVTDFGGVFGISRIQLTPDITILAGAPTIDYVVSYSADNITYVDTTGLEATGVDFQFVKVLATITSGEIGLLRINSLRLKLDVKEKQDTGRGTVTDAVNGAVIEFNKTFVDIQSISVTAAGTGGFVATYVFIDTPNPTEFTAFLTDTSGVKQNGDFSWQVWGV